MNQRSTLSYSHHQLRPNPSLPRGLVVWHNGKVEPTIVYRVYVGIMETKKQATICRFRVTSYFDAGNFELHHKNEEEVEDSRSNSNMRHPNHGSHGPRSLMRPKSCIIAEPQFQFHFA